MADVVIAENTRSWWTLTWFGWCYVAIVAAVAVFAYTSPASDTNASAFLALLLLTIPVGLVGILPAYLIPSLLGGLLGLESDSGSWLVGTAITFMWTAIAWGNAQAVQATLRLIRRRRTHAVATSQETASR